MMMMVVVMMHEYDNDDDDGDYKYTYFSLVASLYTAKVDAWADAAAARGRCSYIKDIHALAEHDVNRLQMVMRTKESQSKA